MTLPIEDVLLLALLLGAMCLLLTTDAAGWLLRRRQAAAAALHSGTQPSRFDTRTPVRQSTEQALRNMSRRPPAPPALPQAADLLLVDDSAVVRAKLRRLFEANGYQVHLACDGVEALALLAKGRYAMMITDLEMPNMDGVALVSACKQQPQTAGMPVIAVSAHENLRAKFNECGNVCGVHRKPWVDDLLLSHVATLVGTRGRVPQLARAHAAPLGPVQA